MVSSERIGRPAKLFIVGIVGFLGGLLTTLVFQTWIIPPKQPQTSLPLPHHIPKYPGGVSLRFAMVHDVLTERFARHGKAYYTERNRLVQKELQQLKDQAKPGQKPSDKYFDLLNDLGAGCQALGQDDAAISVMRDKLKEQEALGIKGRDLYTTYANLGTFLIHENFVKARTGDANAKQLLREGLDFVHKSIEVNPQAHFGREVWQAVAVEFMLAAIENSELLMRFDMVGNSLQAEIDPSKQRCFRESETPWFYLARQSNEFMSRPEDEIDVNDQDSRKIFRGCITHTGGEERWKQARNTTVPGAVPFDEPTLGIIGMWRLGGGANPHFALALGEIMMRVGQRYLAWTTYERANAMFDQFWPNPDVQRKFVEHCRNRQRIIEKQIPSENWDERRQQFQDELAFGQGYQAAYQYYETKRIKEGASIDDEHFYDEFHAQWGPIASPVGPEDKFIVADPRKPDLTISWPLVLFFSGIFAFFTACILRLLR
jgi:hypothetical protein